MYLCIDLKSFYASVECVARNLDSMKTNLVVADQSRGQGALCLAVSPSLKALGVKNRCRLFEIPTNLSYFIAKPRMRLYIKYSALIYQIYLKYVSKDDIYPYSIDEMFLDISSYASYYKNLTLKELAKAIIDDIYQTTGIVATCGIGTNMYLAKVALDILAKHEPNFIAYLDEDLYQVKLGNHRPLTDFWQVGRGIANRLMKYQIYTMTDIKKTNPKLLYQEFGINADILISHALGKDDVTFQDLKDYQRQSHSISLSQILFSDYLPKEARVILNEMVETLVLDLIAKELVTGQISLFIGYSKGIHKSLSKQKIIFRTSNYQTILANFFYLYDNYVLKNLPIRQIGISLGKLSDREHIEYNLFTDLDAEKKELKLFKAINEIKREYGKNAILRGINLLPFATQKMRNTLVGGHHE